MRLFAELYQQLDRLTATNEKRAALSAYFRHAAPEDAAWAIHLLSGGKIGGARARIASSGELREWISEESATPAWLVEASYNQVGDLAETLALLLDDPATRTPDVALSFWIENALAQVANAEVAVRRDVVVGAWRELPYWQRLVFNKLLTGALRIGVSQGLVQQALAEVSGLDISVIAQRMLGEWRPSAQAYLSLLSHDPQPGDAASPYPFYLASPLESSPESLGSVDDWLLEWKWDGIRAQLIRRGTEAAIWSRGEERMDGRFPEVERALRSLPEDAVLDGELLAWNSADASPMPFTALQKRIQRRKPGAKSLADAPVRVLAYDLLEHAGEDLREWPLSARRARLQQVIEALGSDAIEVSPRIEVANWADAARLREESRARGVEGFMLKRLDASYKFGRKRGDWWKWKVDPLTIDAVLIYAQAGHGRRSSLHTDYTFALWEGDALLPVAKAYSGLTDAEILRLDKWIRANTTERFGPVRAVKPFHVFELGFEGVNMSSRHKSGIAVRFPRILRWREDKRAQDADRLESLKALAR